MLHARIPAIMLALILFVFSAPARADEVAPNASVRSGVVIREAPTTASQRLGLLRPGERLDYAGDAPGWHEVRLADGRAAYVIKRWTIRIEAAAEADASGAAEPQIDAPQMIAHFVYVGQGDGAILEFPCGVAVIDSGGQFNGATKGARLFADYLDRFFADRPQFDNTIDVLFTTHPHADHLNGLPLLFNDEGGLRYDIRNVVDNTQAGSAGSLKKQTEFRDAVLASGGGYSGVSVTPFFSAEGVTNAVIDPFACVGVDPAIRVYWGGWEKDAVRDLGGEGRDRSNANNHSLVIRVDFGDASFLFTGDLEESAIGDLLALHQSNPDAFDVDVYQVGHHGSANATTRALMEAMTPEIAIISAGDPADRSPSSAHDHGHPRLDALSLLQDADVGLSQSRNPPAEFPAFESEESEPVPIVIERAIYGTGWEGDLLLRATSQGDYDIAGSPQ